LIKNITYLITLQNNSETELLPTICILFLWTILFSCIGYVASDVMVRVHNELERVWEWLWPILRQSSSIFLEGMRKTTKNS